MSDTLADLSSWIPADFLAADDIPANPTHFPSHPHLHRHPYDFCSPSSTESESDEDDYHHLTDLTHRFTRSVSLQERLQIPYPNQKKRVFSGSPESTLNWNLSSPVVNSDEDSWQRIYAAAGQIARMKMEMNMINRNLHHVPPPNHQHHHLNMMHQQRLNYSGVGAGRCGNVRPVGFRHSAWHPQVETQRRQQTPVNPFGSGAIYGRPAPVVKKECAGTGVFLPRTGFSHGPPESKKKQACLGGHLPATTRVMAQSHNKTMGPTNPNPQPNNIYSGFAPPPHINRAELAQIVRARRHAAMQAQQLQQRRSTNPVGVPETQIKGHPEDVLPQEWTY